MYHTWWNIAPVFNKLVDTLGAVFYPDMNMTAHVSKVIESAGYSLVISHLDYCNGLLRGITDELLYRLQKVQNKAVRVVSGSKKVSSHYINSKRSSLAAHQEKDGPRLAFKIIQGCAPL